LRHEDTSGAVLLSCGFDRHVCLWSGAGAALGKLQQGRRVDVTDERAKTLGLDSWRYEASKRREARKRARMREAQDVIAEVQRRRSELDQRLGEAQSDDEDEIRDAVNQASLRKAREVLLLASTAAAAAAATSPTQTAAVAKGGASSVSPRASLKRASPTPSGVFLTEVAVGSGEEAGDATDARASSSPPPSSRSLLKLSSKLSLGAAAGAGVGAGAGAPPLSARRQRMLEALPKR
jgi:hypothetical protein